MNMMFKNNYSKAFEFGDSVWESVWLYNNTVCVQLNILVILGDAAVFHSL